ncbi:phenylalanine--tRNA ligase subunit beta [bacterium]|nr:MAG: phenylalanine--tRNA ligase subunit beta [bacterium]
MRISLRWLKDYIDVPETPSELAHMLTMAGLEAGAVETLGEGIEDVVVAEILEKGQHPNADRLSLCKVTDGQETYQIVCGATNMSAGDRVALARIGATLPGNFKISKAKLRGVESYGMMCSERELGLSEESSGLLIMPKNAPLGARVIDVLGLPDTIMEVEITPNRPDWLSVFGVAREVSALTGRELRLPPYEVAEASEPASKFTSVEIKAPELCHRYAARLIRGVKIGPSPLWMQNRLKAAGVRPISNVVDVTNYVLMELGHPLHAFDFNRLRGKRIVVDRAKDGDAFVTLDGQSRPVGGENLMICDGEGPVALAGVMGGLNSEVEETTTDILLESAWFLPSNIRRTAKTLGLRTEASYRFERGADIEGLIIALERATRLIVEVAGGEAAKGIVDNYPLPREKKIITLRVPKIKSALGISVPAQEAARLLRGLGLEILSFGENEIKVAAPSFRVDIDREIDLIEEVARVMGYDKIPATMPRVTIAPGPRPVERIVAEKARDALYSCGLQEAITLSFIDPTDDERIGLHPDSELRCKVCLQNPLGQETSVLRTHLLPGLLRVASLNARRGMKGVRLFEVGKTFHPVTGECLPAERMRAAGLMTGRREPLTWWAGNDRLDFFDGKGVVEKVLMGLGGPDLTFAPTSGIPFLQPGRAAVFCAGDFELGWLGEINPDLLDKYELAAPVVAFQFDLDTLLDLRTEVLAFGGLDKFPSVERDMALLLDRSVTTRSVIDAVYSLNIDLVRSVVLFDLYEGEKIPEGKQSLAFRITYRSNERTLTDEEVSQAHEKIVSEMSGRFNARLRD